MIPDYVPKRVRTIPQIADHAGGGYAAAQLKGEPWFTNLGAAFVGLVPPGQANSKQVASLNMAPLIKKRRTQIKPIRVGEPRSEFALIVFDRDEIEIDQRLFDYVLARFGSGVVWTQHKVRRGGRIDQAHQPIIVELDGKIVGAVMPLSPTWWQV